MSQETEPAVTANGLRPNSLGVAGIVFFVVAAAAPLSAVLGSSPSVVGLGTGAGAPSAYLAAGVLLLVFAVGYAAMSSEVGAGGGFASYVEAAFGIRSGRAAGYLAAVAYIAMQAGLYGISGFFANAILGQYGMDFPWWAWSLAMWVVISILAYLDIELSARVLGVVMILEVVVLLVVSVAITADGGPDGIDLTSFSPGVATSGAFGLAMMFAFASFIGFEATAIYSEEAKDRSKTIPRATYVAVTIITLFLVVTVWSFVIGYGSDDVQQAALKSPDSFVFALAGQYVGETWSKIMEILLITSFLASMLAFQNTIARYLRVLALRGWAPAPLAATHPRFRSPHVASMVTSVVSLVMVAIFAIGGLDPYFKLFMWCVGLGTLAIVVLQALTSVAVVAYFRRHDNGLSSWRTVVAPLVGALGLAAAVVLIVDNWPSLVGADSGFSQLLPWLIPVVLAIGLLIPLRSDPEPNFAPSTLKHDEETS